MERFEPPIPVVPSTEEYDATQKAPYCFQRWFFAFQNTREAVQAALDANEITEDCLTIDIYKPEVSEGAGILFWIHGGGFMYGGAGLFDGIEQVKRGNIVVIIQYRLALFGFMNLYNPETQTTVGGNYGLMDQQLALKYTYQNAENMGGDQNKITINGGSIGAMSVALQMLNDDSSK